MRSLIGCLSALTLLAACGGQGAAPGISGSGATAVSSAAGSNWDQMLTAAKQEGRVSVIMPVGEATPAAMVDAFQQKYGITVEALPSQGAELPPRITSERNAGKYLWDISVQGITEVLTGLAPIHAFDPLGPSLMLPEVTDLKNWRGGAYEFSDPDRTQMVMARTLYPTLWVNTNSLKPDEITSYRDFLDPKWKGKFILDDPRRAGPGQALLTLWYLTPGLGADFVRQLAKQQPLLLTNFQQEADMLGQGAYPVLLGGSDHSIDVLIKKGVPIAVVPPTQLKEPPQVAAGSTGLSIFNRALHPNAAKVYANWLLTKDAQTGFARALQTISARVDVPTDHVESWRVPVPNAIKTYGPEVLAARGDVVNLAKEAFQ